MTSASRFLALTVAALALAPSPLRAQGDEPPSPVTFGCAVTGPELGITFHSLQGVAMDHRRGEILVADVGRSEISTYDTTCARLGAYVHRVPGPGGRMVDGAPMHLAVTAAGHTLIADIKVPWVDVVDFSGRSVARLDLPVLADSVGEGAGAMAVAADGTVYVASRGEAGRVHVFGADYVYRGSWGTAGTDSGMVSQISGLAVTPDGLIAVTAPATELGVQLFDRTGRFVRGFGRHISAPGNFALPGGIVATADGRLWVADELRQQVQVFDAAGRYLGVFGGLGRGPGEFRFPRALATDGHSVLVVAERGGNRFQVMRVR